MVRTTNARLTTLALLVVVSLIAAPNVWGYPPDNAAVLYYKASLLCRVDDETSNVLDDFRKGKIELDDRIRDMVKKNREAITTVLDASQVANCDWGINYSRGFELMPPSYGALRELARLIVTEARIQARDGDYRTALDRCLSLHRMASHVNDRLFVSYLVGISINAMAHECMAEVLSYAASDLETLTWVRDHLQQIGDLPLPIEPSIEGERQAGAISITVDRMANVLEAGFDDEAFQKLVLDKVKARDEAFFARNRASWNQYWSDVTAAFDLPYPQAYTKLRQLYAALDGNPDAVFMIALVPNCEKICTLSVRSRTHYNAIVTALELYLARAETERLPDSLPADAPGDLFSGKPFRYEKTGEGFTLHCRSKDLSRDETYEYVFKIPK